MVESPERRRYPRFAASEKLAGHLIDSDLPVRVRDIGLGGFSIETMEPLEAGIEHRVRFVARDDWSTVLPAKIANTRPSCADDGSPLFVSGFAFSSDDAPETQQTVQILIEKVTSVRLHDHEANPDASLAVLHEDAFLLVVNKPAGLVCHPTRDGEHSSLIGRVRLHLKSTEGRLVNRLDRETSGIVLIAKQATAAGELGQIIGTPAVDKEYWAIVHGHPAKDEFLIDAPLGQDVKSTVAIKDTVRPDGAAARTAVTVSQRFFRDGMRFAWLIVKPETGRKHQIRIHLAHAGHPIVGDKVYGGDELRYLRFVANTLTDDDRSALILDNHALHARALSFSWRGRMWQFDAPPDNAFMGFLASGL